jgi:hypothetical protein
MVFLLEHYKLPPSEVRQLPSSLRHRLVKIKEEFNRMASRQSGGDTSIQTGLTHVPTESSQPQQTIGLNYK